jgi:hypothetical protein
VLRRYRGHAPVVPEPSINEKSCDDFHKDVIERLLSIPPGRSGCSKWHVGCQRRDGHSKWLVWLPKTATVVGLVTKARARKNETITNDERKSYDAKQRWRIPLKIS